MEDQDKLPVLIKHWIEHNDAHREEFDKWARRAGELGLADAADAIRAAVDDLGGASANLNRALETLQATNG